MDSKEGHDYVRHSFGLFVQWFTFFGTVNFAILGWLATGKPNKWLAVTVCAVLLINNLFARIGTDRFLSSLHAMAREAGAGTASTAIPPIDMYNGVVKILMRIMVLNVGMWAVAGVVFGFGWD